MEKLIATVLKNHLEDQLEQFKDQQKTLRVLATQMLRILLLINPSQANIWPAE